LEVSFHHGQCQVDSFIYHPETDGQTEIRSKNPKEMLRYFVDEIQSNWDELLVGAVVAYNSAPHSAITFSPYYLNYEMHPRTIPMDIVAPPNPQGKMIANKGNETV
jgi:hypothetical protein